MNTEEPIIREKQLKIRGSVYLHSLLALIGMVFLNGYLRFKGIYWCDELNGAVIMLMLPVTLGVIELLVRDVYPGNAGSILMLVGVFGVCGLIGFIPAFLNLLVSDASFLTYGSLTADGSRLLLSLCCLTITAAALVRYLRSSAKASTS